MEDLTPEQIPVRAINAGDLERLTTVLSEHPQLLKRFYANDTLLHWAATEDHVGVVEYLVKAGIDVNATRERDDFRPLHHAASSGCMNVARWLLDHGGEVNCGRLTPLVQAASEGHLAMVQLLVERGADVNACYTDNRGRIRNPLYQAEGLGHEAVAEYLRNMERCSQLNRNKYR